MPSREATYWRVHEQEYRAIAAGCSTLEAKKLWLAFAERCGDHAAQLEQEATDNIKKKDPG